MVLSCLPGAAPVSKCFSAASRVSVAQGSRSMRFLSQASRVRFLASGLPSAKQISMATGPFCAKSWGGPYGRLPVAQDGL